MPEPTQPDSLGAPAWSERAWRQGLMFALAASLCIHALIVTLSILFGWYGPPTGFATGVGQGETAVELGPESSLTELGEAPIGAGAVLQDALDQHAGVDVASAMPMADAADPTVASPIEGGGAGGAGDPAAFGGGGAWGEGGGGGSGLEGGGGSARFFGVEARGSRFVYLCDVSGSMGEGGRLDALKTALITSIEGLSEGSQYSVIVFSSGSSSLTGPKWIAANEKSKKETRMLIAGITAQGGTLPLPGFDLAFAMKPRPDAVYFMTDGQFGEGRENETVAQIMALNTRGERPSPIHCITLVESSGEKIMKEIARRSGGKYTHVNGSHP